MTSPCPLPLAPHLLHTRFLCPSHLDSFSGLSLCLCFSTSCALLWGASEGKLVVLALAIGVAEQDDFANIPDLQETAQAAPPANQEPPPEKRYQMMYESECFFVFFCFFFEVCEKEDARMKKNKRWFQNLCWEEFVLRYFQWVTALRSHRSAPEIAPHGFVIKKKKLRADYET